MNVKGNFKTTFFVTWLALVAIVVVTISRQDRFFARETPTVARLSQSSGSVVVRAEGLVRWRDVGDGHGFHDGDRIATGRGASSKVSFGEGRFLKLGEDTQIEITAIMQGDGEYAFMVDLLRGTVVAEVDAKCKECPPLVVRAGNERFNVAEGKKVGVFRTAGKKPARFNPKGVWPQKPKAVPQKTFIDTTFLTAKAPEPAPAPPPPAPPPPPPKKVAKASGYEIEIGSSVAGKVWWTTSPLSALGSKALEIPLTKPAALPQDGKWTPFVELAGVGGAKPQLITVKPNDASLVLPIERIKRSATVSRSSYAEYAFQVRGGASIVLNKDKSESLSPKQVDLKIRSYGELPGGPVSVGLDRVAPVEAGPDPWMEPKREIGLESAPVAVHLASAGSDYAKLLPYIRGASAVGVKRTGLASPEGTFVVRNQGIVAQLRGGLVDKSVVSTMMTLLGGDFVFKGPRSALHDARGSSQSDLVGWVNALLDKGKVLYILKRNKVYPVSRDFIKTNSEVAQFIDSQAKAIFLEKVEVLDYR